MELNDTYKKALDVSKIIRAVLDEKAKYTKIYDVVHQENHYEFKIKFLAYDYFCVLFQYELDIIGCSVVVGNDILVPLLEGQFCYSDTDMVKYFNDIKSMLELRIPDKYLIAKGWK